MASGVELASAYIQLIPSLRGAQQTIQRQLDPIGRDQGRRFGDSFSGNFEQQTSRRTRDAGRRLGSSFGRAFAAGGSIVAAAGIGSFLSDSLGEARESQKVSAVTESIVRSTGGAANLTAQQVGDLSAAISEKTGVDDEAIQSGANLLLTFKNVRNEVGKGNDIFTRATQAASDLSAAGFGDLSGASKQLGKALNDPIKGTAALSKSGVTFTEAQKKQIKTLVASGDTLKAQKIILKEVESQVGGAAEASATAGDKASVAFGNLKEEVGTALLPVVDKLATAFVEAIPKIRSVASLVRDKLADGFALVREKLEPLQPIFDKVTQLIRENPDFVRAFAIALGILAGGIAAVTLATTAFSIALNSTGIPLIVIGIAALVAGLVVAYKRSEQFRNIVDQVGRVAQRFGVYLRDVVLPAVVKLAQDVGAKLRPIFDQLATTFVTRILPTLNKVIGKIREAAPAVGQIVSFIGRWIGFLARLGATILGKVLPVIIKLAGFLFSKVVPAFAAVVSGAVRVIGKIAQVGSKVLGVVSNFREFATGVGEQVTRVVNNVSEGIGSLPGKILGYVSDMVSAGASFIGGLFDGIRSAASGAGGLLGDIVSSVADAFRGVINGLIQQLNDAIPNKIKIPGPAPDINLPNNPIPYLAKGTNNFSGGLAVVGENGPELVTLPRGSRVDTAAATRRIIGGPSPLAVAGGGGVAVLRVGEAEFRAYLESVADQRIETAADMQTERSRAGWYR